jgi:hypothetical protein
LLDVWEVRIGVEVVVASFIDDDVPNFVDYTTRAAITVWAEDSIESAMVAAVSDQLTYLCPICQMPA